MPAFISGFSHAAALLSLGAFGFCVGVVMFLLGLRPNRVSLRTAALPESKPAIPNPDPLEPPLSASNIRVIRLSPDPGQLRSADMTQQQKIAAALHKAGISNSPSWSNAEDSGSANASSTVQVMTAPSQPAIENSSEVIRKAAPQKTNTGSPALKRFLLWAGAALALMSLLLLLRLTSW